MNMFNKISIHRVLNLIFFFLFIFQSVSQKNRLPATTDAGFWENKGQYIDQNANLRPDLLYVYHGKAYKLQLKKTSFSYELYKRIVDTLGVSEATGKLEIEKKYKFHRVDIELLGANPNVIIKHENKSETYKNYYLAHTQKDGVRAYNYKKITYQNIYPNIDLVFYSSYNGRNVLKYDFVIRKGGNIADIKLLYKGGDNFSIEKNDGLLKINTSLGNFTENIPFCYEKDTNNNVLKSFTTNYELENNIVTFKTENYNKANTIVIDPVPKFFHTRLYGTYFGGDAEDVSYAVVTDSDNNIYITGRTNSDANIVTSGSSQGTIGGGRDIFIAKFDKTLSNRMWATYFGGTGIDVGNDIKISGSNIYVVGETDSDGISTFGSENAQGNDIILAKFSLDGIRSWATYYGGAGEDFGLSLDVNPAFIAVTGKTTSQSGISTAGAFQNNIGSTTGYNDGVLISFTLSGICNWATYYGGIDEDEITSVSISTENKIFIAGNSVNVSGNFDGFIANFSSTGSRNWGVSFGGTKDDIIKSVNVKGNSVVICGSTKSPTGIATSGCHQNTHGGVAHEDAFVAKLDLDGTIQWGTYYGGSLKDIAHNIFIDDNKNIVLIGTTLSTNGVGIVAESFRDELNGDHDAFSVKFNTDGKRLWSTYIGNAQEDRGFGITVDNLGYWIVTGLTRSTEDITENVISTPYDQDHNGANDAFIQKYCDLIIIDQSQNKTVWTGNSVSFNISAIGSNSASITYQWYKGTTALTDNSVISGSKTATLTISPVVLDDKGLYTCKVKNDCGELTSDNIELIVKEIEITPSKICLNQSSKIKASPGGELYIWSVEQAADVWTDIQQGVGLNEITVTPTTAGKYNYRLIVSGFNLTDDIAYVSLTVHPLPIATANANPLTTCSGELVNLSGSATNGTPTYIYSWTSTPAGFSKVGQIHTANPDKTTTYNLKVTDNEGCIDTDEVTITIKPLPFPYNLLKGGGYCAGDAGVEITLSGSDLNTSYQLQHNGSPYGSIVNGTGVPLSFGTNSYPTGTYTVMALNSNTNCSNNMSNSVTVTVHPLPNTNAGADKTFCKSSTISEKLEGQSPFGGTYTGSVHIGGTMGVPIFIPTVLGDYTITYSYTDLHGCKNTDDRTIHVVESKEVDAGSDSESCVNGNSVSLFATPTGGKWSGLHVTSNTFTPPSVPGDYILTYYIGTKGSSCYNEDTRLIKVVPLPNVDAGEIEYVCSNEPAFALSGHSPIGGTFSGSAAVTANGNFDPSKAKIGNNILTYTYIDPSTNCENTDVKKVFVHGIPLINATDISFCNQAVGTQLIAKPASGTFSGSPYVTSGGIFTPSGIPTGIGMHQVTYSYTDANSCTNTATINVTVKDVDLLQMPSGFELCKNDPNVIIEAKPVSGNWSGDIVSTSGTVTTGVVGNFTLTYTYEKGTTCELKGTVDIIINSLPVVNAHGDDETCYGDPNFIQTPVATPANGIWTGTGIIDKITGRYNTTHSGTPYLETTSNITYTFTDNNGCTSFDTKKITVRPLEKITLDKTTVSLCLNPSGSNLLKASPETGIWTYPDGTTIIDNLFIPNTVGDFDATYTFTTTYGCISSDITKVTVTDEDDLVMPSDIEICKCKELATINTNVPNGKWSGTGVDENGKFNTCLDAGNYILTYTAGEGTCIQTGQMTITILALPVVKAKDKTVCEDQPTINLDGNVVGTWTIFSGIGSIAGSVFNTAGAGISTVSLSHTDANGCINTDKAIMTVNKLPNVDAGKDETICNQPIESSFEGTPAGGTWSGLLVTADGKFTPNGTGVFEFVYTFTDANGCTNSDTKTVTVIPAETIDIGIDREVCIGATPFLIAATPTGGTWTGTHITISGVFDPKVAGEYILTYSYGSGTCLKEANITVKVNPLPVITPPANIEICADNASFNITDVSGFVPTGGNYFGTGITNASLGRFDPSVSSVGVFKISYTYIDPLTTCSNTATMTITVNALPISDFIFPAACENAIINFIDKSTSKVAISSWQWDFGDGQNSTDASPAHPYSSSNDFDVKLTVTDANSCTASTTKKITVNKNPIADFAANTVCKKNPTKFSDLSINNGGSSINTREWNFGDGSPLSMLENPEYTFLDAGVHNVRFVVINESTCSDTIWKEILVYHTPNPNFESDKACFKKPTNFIDKSVDDHYKINVWEWRFGDGTNEIYTESTNPKYTYLKAGTFKASLININEKACSDTIYKNVVVNPLPKIDFSYEALGCENVTVIFTNTTTGACSTCDEPFKWIIDDKIIISDHKPLSWTFTKAGFYKVKLIGKTAHGCVDSISHTLQIIGDPSPDFEIFPKNGCTPHKVGFVNKTTALFASYVWSFGNGKSSTQHTPLNVVYDDIIKQNTKYEVFLQATNICGSKTVRDTVTVYPDPIAKISSSLSSGCSPLTVKIFNLSNTVEYDVCKPEDAILYQWFLEDKLISTKEQIGELNLINPSKKDSIFNLELVVTTCCGNDTAYFDINVHPQDVEAFYNIDKNTGCPPLEVKFTNSSIGAVAYSWIIDDKTVFSNQENPIYNFENETASIATYNVCLVALSECSKSVFCQDIFVYPKPKLKISVVDTICVNDTLFVNNNSSDLTSCLWLFGNGETSTKCNTSVVYKTTGIYEITFIGKGTENSCFDSLKHKIYVVPKPDAKFTVSSNCDCDYKTFYFKVSTINPNTSEIYLWDFGDGTTYIGQNAEHIYKKPGTYVVTLKITNCNNCEDSYSTTICVYETPSADFDVSIGEYSCVYPVSVNFTNKSKGGFSYKWDFGNGQSSSEQNPQPVSYDKAGVYTVSLAVFNTNNCVDTLKKTVIIYEKLKNKIVSQDTIGCSPFKVQFIGNNASQTNYFWNFGDGTNSNEANPIHTYYNNSLSDKVYTIKMTASYDKGACEISDIKTITVRGKPIADFNYDLIPKELENGITCGQYIRFNNLSVEAIDYIWHINNTFINDSIPENEFDFLKPGIYPVKLTAISKFFCKDSITKKIAIWPQTYYAPNAMLPCCSDCESEAKYFQPKGAGIKEGTYEIRVYNKWGVLMWRSTEIVNGQPTGKWEINCDDDYYYSGVYYWQASGEFENCCRFVLKGNLTLIK